MRNILKIFTSDIRSVCKHFFALLVAAGLVLLPCLYAWINIYANWNPYESTGNMKMAIVSQDQGYKDADGTYYNKGEDVVRDLLKNTKIDWKAIPDAELAIEDTKAGKYYAAVVIEPDFTKKMFNMLQNWDGRSSISYYQNYKKNAVATKITDGAVESLQNSINSAYVEVVVSEALTLAQKTSSGMSDNTIKDVNTCMQHVENLLLSTEKLIDTFRNVGTVGNTSGFDAEKLNERIAQLNRELDRVKEVPTIAELNRRILEVTTRVRPLLDELLTAAADPERYAEAVELAKEASSVLQETGDMVHEWGERFDPAESETERLAQKWAFTISGFLYDGAAQIGKFKNLEDIPVIVSDCSEILDLTEDFIRDNLVPTLDDLKNTISSGITDASELLSLFRKTSEDAGKLKGLLSNVKVDAGKLSDLLSPVLDDVITSVHRLVDKIESMTGSEQQEYLNRIVNGDSEKFGNYFSQIVETQVYPIYEVENYGSAMTPFYTVLAIWVGVVMLGAIIQAQARTENLVDPKPRELFFGRYLLFFLLNQLQAFLIVMGDLVILKVQCENPGMLFLTTAIVSFVFSLFVYAFVITFGIIGKAVVVIMLIIQIAGSSGTLPIEMLPEFYQKMYSLFPFPYAIKAMRECMFGMNLEHYRLYIISLMIFAVTALLIGLLVRKPIMNLTKYVGEKIEDTKLL